MDPVRVTYTVRDWVTALVGAGVGLAVGLAVARGRLVDFGVGLGVGSAVGVGVGSGVGDGDGVGVAVGVGVGVAVGLGVGLAVLATTGGAVISPLAGAAQAHRERATSSARIRAGMRFFVIKEHLDRKKWKYLHFTPGCEDEQGARTLYECLSIKMVKSGNNGGARPTAGSNRGGARAAPATLAQQVFP